MTLEQRLDDLLKLAGVAHGAETFASQNPPYPVDVSGPKAKLEAAKAAFLQEVKGRFGSLCPMCHSADADEQLAPFCSVECLRGDPRQAKDPVLRGLVAAFNERATGAGGPGGMVPTCDDQRLRWYLTGAFDASPTCDPPEVTPEAATSEPSGAERYVPSILIANVRGEMGRVRRLLAEQGEPKDSHVWTAYHAVAKALGDFQAVLGHRDKRADVGRPETAPEGEKN